MSRRGRRLAIWSVVAAVAVMALSLWAFRRQIEEAWQVHRLGSEDHAVREDALRRLEVVGGDRSVAALVRLLGGRGSATGHDEHGKHEADVLAGMFHRLSRYRQEDAAAGLREAALRNNWRSMRALRRVGPQCSGIFPLLAEDCLSSEEGPKQLAWLVLMDGWPLSREEIAGCAARADPKELLRLFERICSSPPLAELERVSAPNVAASHAADPRFERKPAAALLEPARYLALRHQKPEVRALGLAFAVVRSRGDPDDIDLELLREVYAGDPHELPRRAALRIAGRLGRREGTIDLAVEVCRAMEASLRSEAIQARDLWSSLVEGGIELWDGAAVEWIARGLDTTSFVAWSEAEVECLEAILRVEKDPGLRDAASMALAGRYRGFVENPSGTRDACGAPDLVVHEWGVWRDGGGVLAAARTLDELPGFVHRSFTTTEEISKTRLELGVVTKPVVYFYSPSPLSILLDVRFRGGRPWTFYPEPTDYTETLQSPDDRFPPGIHVEGVHPPWLPTPSTEDTTRQVVPQSIADQARLSGELRRRYRSAPWLVPSHPVQASSRMFPPRLSGMGVEWCGLRVGYPGELEAGLEPPGGSPWWGFLREVPSALVAVRGDAERFVFYDGAIGVSAPLLVAWEDASRSALLLLARSFQGQALLSGKLQPASTSRNRKGPIPAIFVIHRAGGRVLGRLLKDIFPGGAPLRLALADLDLEGESLVSAFDGALREEGLTAEESRSLVRTWRPELFETDGPRAVTVLPRWIYDSIIDLRIAPVPREVVRVGLVWKECDDLGTGHAAFGPDAPDVRWRTIRRKRIPVPVEISRVRLPSAIWEPLPEAGRSSPILRLGRGSPYAISGDGRTVLLAIPAPGVTVGVGSTCHLVDLESLRSIDLTFLGAAAKVEHAFSPTLSADGRKVGLAGRMIGGACFIFVADVESATLTLVNGVMPQGCKVSLSAGGERIAYSSPGAAGVVDLAAGAAEEIEVGNHDSIELSGDGRRATVEVGDYGQKELHLVDFTTGDVTRLSGSPGDDSRAGLSSDGRFVIFNTSREGDSEIYLADVEARSLRNLSNFDGNDEWPAIASGGRRAVFARGSRLLVIDLETGRLAPVPGGDRGSSPCVSYDGSRIAFTRSESDGPVAYVADLEP